MLKRILLAIVILSNVFLQDSHAADRNLDELLANDRQERIQKINEITIEINQALLELTKFRADLDSALKREKTANAPKITIRNGSAVVAAIGLIGTIIYQSKAIAPNKLILSGGYALSAIATIITYLENRSIHLTREEVEKLTASVKDLEEKIVIEKSNLSREIRLLCLEDGGSPEACDQYVNQLR